MNYKDPTYSYISVGIVTKNIENFDRVPEKKCIGINIPMMLLPPKTL